MRENKFQVHSSAGKAIASVSWEIRGNVREILEQMCQNQSTAIRADIKKTNEFEGFGQTGR
jgi:hypothetical protein